MKKINVQDALEQITRKDPRYDRDAYIFLREALDHTLKTLKRPNRDEAIAVARETGEAFKRMMSHVSGQELLAGIRGLALEQYGPLAKTVLDHWGVKRCEDFGEIVFNMVEFGLLGKTEKDTKADFAGGYDFDEAFLKPFQPITKEKFGSRVRTASEDSTEADRTNN